MRPSVTITVNAAPSSFSLGSTGTYLVIGVVLLVVVVLAVVLLMRRGRRPAPSAQPWQSGTPRRSRRAASRRQWGSAWSRRVPATSAARSVDARVGNCANPFPSRFS